MSPSKVIPPPELRCEYTWPAFESGVIPRCQNVWVLTQDGRQLCERCLPKHQKDVRKGRWPVKAVGTSEAEE